MRTHLLALAAWAAAAHQWQYPWQNPDLPTDQRVENLISLLNISEKVSLLSSDSAAISRIGLPSYSWAHECERGDSSGPLGTAYPTGMALAATFMPQLIYEIAYQTAIEVRGNVNTHGGGLSCFGPVSNMIKTSTWGRSAEMLTGEDATIGRVNSRAFTFGIQQGTNSTTKYRMINTIAKHLNTYAGPEGYGYTFGPHAERFNVNASLTEREWREYFLPAFYGSAEAGVSGFMCSYSAISLTDAPEKSLNTPACANSYLLTDIVRGEWNHTGYILSDAGAVAFIAHALGDLGHGYAANLSDAAVKAISAGMDIELTCCGAPAVFPTLTQSVQAGIIPESLLDRSLRRTLPYRFELGQLDPPGSSPYDSLNQNNVSTAYMAQLAATAAQKAIILLKNSATPSQFSSTSTSFLPLSAAALAGKRICVLGPNANNTLSQEAGYVNNHPRQIITPYMGIAAALPQSTVLLGAGCNTTACPSYDPSIISLAASCDLNIAVIGLTAYAYSKNESTACGCPMGDSIEGECCDRYDIALPGAQLQLLQAVAAVGKPLVVISVNAGMVDLSWPQASSSVGAMLLSIYLAQATGIAVANTLLGTNNPAARLPITYYNSLSDLGNISDYSMTNRTYRNFPGPVLYPFGYGLSYSTFTYSQLSVNGGPSTGLTVAPCTVLNITFTVTNTHPTLAGEDIPQLYMSIHNATVPVNLKKIVNWKRVPVPAADGAVQVTLSLLPEDNSVMRDPDFVPVIEPGVRTFYVGASSDAAQSPSVAGSFTVTGSTTPLAQCSTGKVEQHWSSSAQGGAARWHPFGGQ